MESKNNEIRDSLLKKRVIIVNEDIYRDLCEWINRSIHVLLSLNEKKDIYLLLDTDGGLAHHTLKVRDLLKAIPVNTIGIVNGRCNSAGLILFSGCTKKFALLNSTFYFHHLRGTFEIKESYKYSENYLKIKNEIASLKKSVHTTLEDGFGLTKKQIIALCLEGEKFEHHYSVQEMLKLGVIDKIITKLPFYFPEAGNEE